MRLAVTARSLRRPSHRRTIFGADPELISHMEDVPNSRATPSAATAATDWTTIAKETVAWTEDRKLPTGGLRAS
jgi:hypothetical protein